MKIKCKFGKRAILSAGVSLAALGGCVHTDSTVEISKPIEVKIAPIEATLNVNVRIQKEVDNAFDSVYGPTTQVSPATRPAAS